MKTLQNVLQTHEQNRQKVIGSLELNKEEIANQLLEEYKGLTYTTILDNTTKSQVSFSQHATQMLEIEDKEKKELQNLKTIKDILLQQEDMLENKAIILDETMIQKQQHLLNLKNLEEKTNQEIERLEKLYAERKKDWEEENKTLDKTVKNWESAREDRLKKEEEFALYEHNQKLQEIKDNHSEELDILTKDFETQERLNNKDIYAQRKELDAKSKVYDESKEYIENFETLVSDKVSKQSGVKLGFLKQEHENNIKREKNAFVNQLDVLELDLANKTESCESKKSTIAELKEKLSSAKDELNKLTQNTLTV